MCYSAQAWQDYRKYVRVHGASIGLEDFIRLFWDWHNGAPHKLPKAMLDAFADPATCPDPRIRQWIEEWKGQQATALEQELFAQKTRLVGAQRALQSKVTKKAQDDVRIAKRGVAVICEMLGIPEEDQEQTRRWSESLLSAQSPEGQEEIRRNIRTFIDYLQRLFAEKRDNPGDDMISQLLHVEVDGDRLTEDEILEFCRDKIAHYKVPRYIRFVPEMPMTITGKVQKFVMRDQMIKELQVEPTRTA